MNTTNTVITCRQHLVLWAHFHRKKFAYAMDLCLRCHPPWEINVRSPRCISHLWGSGVGEVGYFLLKKWPRQWNYMKIIFITKAKLGLVSFLLHVTSKTVKVSLKCISPLRFLRLKFAVEWCYTVLLFTVVHRSVISSWICRGPLYQDCNLIHAPAVHRHTCSSAVLPC